MLLKSNQHLKWNKTEHDSKLRINEGEHVSVCAILTFSDLIYCREDLSHLQSHIDAKLTVAEELAKLQQQRKTKDLRKSM